MPEVSYTVECSFSTDCPARIIQQWLDWLVSGHIQDVLDGGATSGEIFEMEAPAEDGGDVARRFEIRYRFPDRAAFESYEQLHAPRLRDEGLQKFPLDNGLSYRRTVGTSQFHVS